MISRFEVTYLTSLATADVPSGDSTKTPIVLFGSHPDDVLVLLIQLQSDAIAY